jgi:hypothetical protein
MASFAGIHPNTPCVRPLRQVDSLLLMTKITPHSVQIHRYSHTELIAISQTSSPE